MAENPVELSTSGPGETLLPEEPADVLAALEAAMARPEGERRDAVAVVAASYPTSLLAWARLGEVARDPVESYACFRVGYHRGLDRLRQHGWRGSQYVPWRHPGNRGFLLALDGLGRAAAAIGETEEAERCASFLGQLDPRRET